MISEHLTKEELLAMIVETITKELPTFHQLIETICLKNRITLALFVESMHKNLLRS